MSLAAVLAFVAVPAVVEAQDTEWNRYTLEDLGGIFIRIESNDVCAAAGVTPEAYEADIALKLIDSEVGVLTQAEMLEHPAMPELRVTLDCASGANGMSGAMAYSVSLRVQQSAQMLRDTQITLPEAVTWFTSEVGVTSEGQATDEVGASLMAGIEAFAEAWTAINAEEEGGL